MAEAGTWSPSELLAAGRRHLAVKDFTSAVETLANACELLAKEHGDTADQCAEAYLWYGKSLLGLSREESGVLGDGMPGTGNADEEEDDNEEQEDGDEEQNGDAEAEPKENGTSTVEKSEAESTTNDEPTTSKVEPATSTDEPSTSNGEPATSTHEPVTSNDEPGSSNAEAASSTADEPGPSNGDANESVANLDAEDDVDNLQLAWEMLDLSRSILLRRVQDNTTDTARALLADVHLALGEVALESETYDKAVIDMQSCLDIQKDLYGNDDRRIAETHYQIGLANSLGSNFEDAITHFKNAANILQSRIKNLENSQDAAKKLSTDNSVEAEIKELKELLPEIQEKIQDMMDYKAETIKRVRESLCPTNGDSIASSSSTSKAVASDISHLIKRKRKASEGEADSSAKKPNTSEPK